MTDSGCLFNVALSSASFWARCKGLLAASPLNGRAVLGSGSSLPSPFPTVNSMGTWLSHHCSSPLPPGGHGCPPKSEVTSWLLPGETYPSISLFAFPFIVCNCFSAFSSSEDELLMSLLPMGGHDSFLL